jgi:hypothetical protein
MTFLCQQDAIDALSKWFTSCCSLLPLDSTSLARSLVTLKYIASVDALYNALQNNPDMLDLDLKQSNECILQIKNALVTNKKNVFLNALKTNQVCALLDHHNMPNVKRIVIDNEINGKIVFDSTDKVQAGDPDILVLILKPCKML